MNDDDNDQQENISDEGIDEGSDETDSYTMSYLNTSSVSKEDLELMKAYYDESAGISTSPTLTAFIADGVDRLKLNLNATTSTQQFLSVDTKDDQTKFDTIYKNFQIVTKELENLISAYINVI
ncbi:unnamed protein product, partial [Didymodactylos carnosus]